MDKHDEKAEGPKFSAWPVDPVEVTPAERQVTVHVTRYSQVSRVICHPGSTPWVQQITMTEDNARKMVRDLLAALDA